MTILLLVTIIIIIIIVIITITIIIVLHSSWNQGKHSVTTNHKHVHSSDIVSGATSVKTLAIIILSAVIHYTGFNSRRI